MRLWIALAVILLLGIGIFIIQDQRRQIRECEGDGNHIFDANTGLCFDKRMATQ